MLSHLLHPSDLRHVSVEYVRKTLTCVWAGKHIDYVATPIETGIRYIEWYENFGKHLTEPTEFRRQHIAKVIEPNQAAARKAVLMLAAERQIYCPVDLYFPEWTHADYMDLYCSLIPQHVSRMFFLDGWMASQGCVTEFCVAVENNLPCFRQDRSALPYDDGLRAVQSTLPHLVAANIDTRVFAKLLDRLTWLVNYAG